MFLLSVFCVLRENVSDRLLVSFPALFAAEKGFLSHSRENTVKALTFLVFFFVDLIL